MTTLLEIQCGRAFDGQTFPGATLSRQLEKTGTPANKDTVSKLLYEQELRRRKAQKKRTMKQYKDLNAQFENISGLNKEKMTIQFDKLLPKWNYMVVPSTG